MYESTYFNYLDFPILKLLKRIENKKNYIYPFYIIC